MADNVTRSECAALRERCLEKASYYFTMVKVCDAWLLVHDKLFGECVTQKEDPGAGS